jgi:chemotaxis protein methyltransferase CheR
MNEILSVFFASLEKHTGIALDLNKKYLVDSRLKSTAKDHGFNDVAGLLDHLNKTPLGGLHYLVFDALTTNETMFFRDPHVFETLRTKLIPQWIQARGKSKKLRIWSAASSTGQEAYSIAMMLCEMIPDIQNWDIQIVATDFSERSLTKAKEAVYTSFELGRGMSKPLTLKYFSAADADGSRRVNQKIRDMVRFSLLNLVDTWPSLPCFDLVCLRNVLIYFNQDTKNKVLAKVGKLIEPVNGVLLLGASEMIPVGSQFRLFQVDKMSYYKALSAER